MKLYQTVLGTLSSMLLIHGAALATGNQQHQMDDLEQFKSKCLQMQANEQLKPFSVDVSCQEISYLWKPATNDKGEAQQQQQISVDNDCEIGGTVRFKHLELNYQGGKVDINQSSTPCGVLERWKKTIPSVDVKIDCQALNDIQSIQSYCQQIVKQREQKDAGIAQYEKTGEYISTCAPVQVLQYQ